MIKPLRGLCRWGISIHHKGMQRSSFASYGTSLHLFPVLLMRYNYLHLILYFRKPLQGLCRRAHLQTVRVCKGPPLHYAVLVLALLPSSGMLSKLESLYEACADEDICTPLWYAKVLLCIMRHQFSSMPCIINAV